MGALTKLEVKNAILAKAALGNSNRDFVDVCHELVDAYISEFQEEAELMGLDHNTLRRFKSLKDSETGRRYNPSIDTVQRILRHFGTEVHFETTTIQKRYQNKPKEY